MQVQHAMQFDSEKEGTEVWICPICDRTYLIEWSPVFRKVTVKEGDKSAIHSINKNGFNSFMIGLGG